MAAAAQHGAVRSRRRAVVWVVLLAILASGAFWVWHTFDPPWRVRVSVANIPVGTHSASLVADSGGTLRNMDWSPKSELAVPFTMHPADCGWSSHDPDRPTVDWDAYVRWQPGERYGVVTRRTDGTWRLSWFEAAAVPVRGQRWPLGGGEATFDVAAGQMQPLAPEQVSALGLDKVIAHNYGDRRTGGRDAPPARRDSAMRLVTRLLAALVLAGALANAARAQVPGVSTAAPGPYSVYGRDLTYRQLDYTGPYSVYGPGLTYRQLDYTGPYSGRLSSASSPARTRTNSDPSLRTAGSLTQAGNGRGQGGDATRMDAGRATATGGEPGVRRSRYVRISIAGSAIQAVVIR